MTDASLLCPCCGTAIPANTDVLTDVEAGFVVANGRVARLTKLEAELWFSLWNARPRVLSQEKLMDEVYWREHDIDVPDQRIIDVMVCKIRKKLSALNLEIQTVWGRGYRVVPPSSPTKGDQS